MTKFLPVTASDVQIDLGVIDPIRCNKADKREFLKKAFGAVVLVDVTNKDARRNAQKYIDDFRSINSDGPVVLAYNKLDLIDYDGPLIKNAEGHVKIFSSMLTGLSVSFILTLPIRLYIFRRAKDAVLPELTSASFVKRYSFREDNCN